MVNLSGLSVRVSAQTAKFTAGMSRVKENAGDAALALRRLSFASESAESNLDEVGRSAVGASGGMTTFMATTEGAGFAVNGLSTTIMLSLVPALGVLASALTPVVFALGGLAAIAGSIGFVGLVGVMGAIATHGNELKLVFNQLLDVIKTEFAPVFDLAASALMVLMGELMRVIPELVPAQDVVSRLAANFLDLGSALIDLLPALMDLATTLAVEFLPPFVTFVEDVLPQTPDLIAAMVEEFRNVLPLFLDFGRYLGRFLPELLEFGRTALPIVADALGLLGGVALDALELINGLGQSFANLAAGGSLALPAIAGLVSFLGGPATLAIGAVVGAVVGMAQAFKTNFANIRTYFTGLWNQFKRVIPALKGAFNAFVSGMDIGQITRAFRNFESVLGKQLLLTLEALKPVFGDIVTLLRENKEEFRLIGGVVGDLVSGLLRVGAAVVNVIYPAIRTLLIPAFRTFIDAVDFALTLMGDLIEASNNIREGNFKGAQAAIAESTAPSELFNIFAGQQQEMTQQQLNQRIEVIVEGDTGVVKDVAAKAADDELSARERAVNRNRGREGVVRR